MYTDLITFFNACVQLPDIEMQYIILCKCDFEIQRYGNGIMSVVPRSPVIVSSIAKTEGEGMGDSIMCVMPMPTKLEKSRNVLCLHFLNTMQYFVSFGNAPGSSPWMDTTRIGYMILALL